MTFFIGRAGGGGGSYANPTYATTTGTHLADNHGKVATHVPAAVGWIVISYS